MLNDYKYPPYPITKTETKTISERFGICYMLNPLPTNVLPPSAEKSLDPQLQLHTVLIISPADEDFLLLLLMMFLACAVIFFPLF